MQDDISQMIKDCENRESKLSPWEQGFVSSISDQFEKSGFLTPKQADTLEKIWQKVT